MNKKNKQTAGRVIGLIFAILLIGGGIGIFISSRLLGDDFNLLGMFGTSNQLDVSEPEPGERERLLDRLPIISNTSHNTPQELMYDFIDVLTLLYGNHLTDELMFTEVLRVQRSMFSEELLEMNPFDTQVQNFTTEIRTQRSHGVYQSYIELVDIQFETDYSVAHVTQHFYNFGAINWVYFLTYEDGFKISSFFQANENFVPFENWLNPNIQY